VRPDGCDSPPIRRFHSHAGTPNAAVEPIRRTFGENPGGRTGRGQTCGGGAAVRSGRQGRGPNCSEASTLHDQPSRSEDAIRKSVHNIEGAFLSGADNAGRGFAGEHGERGRPCRRQDRIADRVDGKGARARINHLGVRNCRRAQSRNSTARPVLRHGPARPVPIFRWLGSTVARGGATVVVPVGKSVRAVSGLSSSVCGDG
jgi:hypothetical protein